LPDGFAVAQTNLKVGEVRVRRKRPVPVAQFVVVCSTYFGSRSTIWRFYERYCGGLYSLVSFLFAVLLLTV